MADYVRAQRINVGSVRVRFGEPLSLREGLERFRPSGSADGGSRLAMQKVAFEVCVRINRATPVTAISLVTLALLGVRDRALTLDEVQRLVAPLLDYVEARGLPSGGLELLREAPAVRGVLEALAREGVVTCHAEGTEPVYAIEPGQHNVAAFYRNGAAHWFLNRAIVELALLHAAQEGGSEPLDKARRYALAVRDLLKYEFFFADKREFVDELGGEAELIDPAWQERLDSPAGARALLADGGFLVAHRVLRSFLESYLVVAEQLAAHDPSLPLDEKAFLTQCAGVGRQQLLQRRVHSPESVSREIFATALELAGNRQLVQSSQGAPDDLARRRHAFAREIAGVVEHLTAIDAIDATIRGEERDAAA
jgi:glycerol-3-phosphate O-acyltransferase